VNSHCKERQYIKYHGKNHLKCCFSLTSILRRLLKPWLSVVRTITAARLPDTFSHSNLHLR